MLSYTHIHSSAGVYSNASSVYHKRTLWCVAFFISGVGYSIYEEGDSRCVLLRSLYSEQNIKLNTLQLIEAYMFFDKQIGITLVTSVA